MIHFIEHILGVCSDSKLHLNLIGFLLESPNFNIILSYIKTWRKQPMKCIKNKSNGNIIRVEDRVAYNMVGREWNYSPKSEWKTLRPLASEKQVVEEDKKEVTLSEKALRRKKIKEQQRQ
jgi:hypothetical protein